MHSVGHEGYEQARWSRFPNMDVVYDLGYRRHSGVLGNCVGHFVIVYGEAGISVKWSSRRGDGTWRFYARCRMISTLINLSADPFHTTHTPVLRKRRCTACGKHRLPVFRSNTKNRKKTLEFHNLLWDGHKEGGEVVPGNTPLKEGQ